MENEELVWGVQWEERLMPCNMPAKGSIVKLRPLGEEESLRGILESYLAGRRGLYKLDMIFDTERDSCRLILEVSDGEIIAGCLDCAGGVKKASDAIEALAGMLSEQVIRGYLELHEISQEAVGVDKDLEPNAFLREPVRLEDLYAGQREQVEGEETRVEPTREAKAAAQAVAGVGAATHESQATVVALAELDIDAASDIPLMLAESIIYSRTIASNKSINELLEKALRDSREVEDAFCRIYFEAGGKAYNVLVYRGSVCAVIEVGGEDIRVLSPGECRGDLLQCLGLEESEVRGARLYRVSLQASLAKLLELCRSNGGEAGGPRGEEAAEPRGATAGESPRVEGGGGASQESVGAEKREEKRKRGFLSRLFRRRR